MNNVNKKFDQLEKIQADISKKLDRLETKFLNNKGLHLEQKIDMFDNEDEYKLQCDLENLLKERSNKSPSNGKKDREVEKNYLHFYECLSEINKQKMRMRGSTISHHSFEKTTARKELVDKGVETDKPVLITFEEPLNQENLKRLNHLSPLDNINKQAMHKKQNQFLTNELVNLRVKLNNIKMKNNLFQILLKDNEAVKNCKLMEKLITGFIEKLAINWHEIVDKIIDDLLEEEIINLNEIELEKMGKRKIKFTKFEEILKDCPEGEKDSDNVFKDKSTVQEINNMISSYKYDEDAIYKKYFDK